MADKFGPDKPPRSLVANNLTTDSSRHNDVYPPAMRGRTTTSLSAAIGWNQSSR